MKLMIYHTNDIHSNFTNLAGIASYLKEFRKPSDFYFDCGDLCDLKDLMVQGTKGKGAISLLEEMRADSMVVGNNEIDLENNSLAACSEGNVPLLSCNLVDNDGNMFGQIKKSLILEKLGVRFLIIGTSPYYSSNGQANKYNVFFMMGNIMTIDPIPQIKNEINRNQGKFDYCILLSHSGLEVEKRLLEEIPEIDLCIGGHSHSLCSFERYSQAGKFGQHLGVIELTIKNKKVVEMKAKSLENTFEPDFSLMKCFQKQQEIALGYLEQSLYKIEDLNWSVKDENELTDFIADALYYEYPCDLAFINSGIVEGSIEGEVSKKKLIELSPSKLNPTRFPILGKHLKEAIVHSLDNEFVIQSGRGPGVRGTVLGTLGFSYNVRVQKTPFTVWISGELLCEDKVYDCISSDAIQRGTGYSELKTGDEQAQFYNGFIRDLLERTLNNGEILKTNKIKRLI
jgi:2',3'-cyclic-nucleotide 2'-phosphodiesterase (5'-nucleotidase family)